MRERERERERECVCVCERERERDFVSTDLVFLNEETEIFQVVFFACIHAAKHFFFLTNT